MGRTTTKLLVLTVIDSTAEFEPDILTDAPPELITVSGVRVTSVEAAKTGEASKSAEIAIAMRIFIPLV